MEKNNVDFEVVEILASMPEIAKPINNVINKRKTDGWEFVPPIVSVSGYSTDNERHAGKLLLTFKK